MILWYCIAAQLKFFSLNCFHHFILTFLTSFAWPLGTNGVPISRWPTKKHRGRTILYHHTSDRCSNWSRSVPILPSRICCVCSSERERFPRETRPAWVPVLHENRWLQIWCYLQVSPSEREASSCSKLCAQSHWPSSTPCKSFLFLLKENLQEVHNLFWIWWISVSFHYAETTYL